MPNLRRAFMIYFRFNRNQSGFTLIELLVVMAIIAFLAGIVLIAINPVKHLKQSRDTKRKSDIVNIHKALQQSIVDNAAYPAENACDSSIGSSVGACPSAVGSGWDTGSPLWQVIVGEDFMASLPKDPINDVTHHYRYEPDSPGEGECTTTVCDMWVGARLEHSDDPSKPIFRCSTKGSLPGGGGCAQVGDWYE